MDIEAFRIRTKKSVADLAELLGVKQAAIYNYKYGKSKPSYESIEKMLLDGAYLSEVFNEEVQKKVSESLNVAAVTNSVLNEFDTPEFRAGVRKALEDMKARGLI